MAILLTNWTLNYSTTSKPTIKTNTTAKPNTTNTTKLDLPSDPTYYDQFLKTTTLPKNTISDTNSTIWYELLPTDEFNSTTTMLPEDELWESVASDDKGKMENLKDVELLFDNYNGSGVSIQYF